MKSFVPTFQPWACMQLTVHDGNRTLISLPKEPQHHLTNRLQAMCLFFLMIRMWRHHTAACIATMQLVTRSNSGKLRRGKSIQYQASL